MNAVADGEGKSIIGQLEARVLWQEDNVEMELGGSGDGLVSAI